ncbi:putative membrane protein [Psychromicrobium silvestre]|uniref:Putative membrane protein n=1 Tax=Psychromicrobium silvestre TaxID=1645614 RepID=A0A7Y9LT90_9MICC|nr:hypothetical protein [Psychromicrobium silvestre]NYE95162.1 putative membrane protein [Psychromicrobium silvestre]
MTIVIWVVTLVACVVAIFAAYLVVADFWSDRTPSHQDQMTRIKQEADATVHRLDASYRQALRDMRRHRR